MSSLDRLVLTRWQRALLGDVLRNFENADAAIVAYGSRATGTARPNSDLDLATVGPGGKQCASELWLGLEESDLPFFSDVLYVDSHIDPAMRQSILRDGIAIAGSLASNWKELVE